jgi:hypothetical protein
LNEEAVAAMHESETGAKADIAAAAANVCIPEARSNLELNASIKNAILLRLSEGFQ